MQPSILESLLKLGVTTLLAALAFGVSLLFVLDSSAPLVATATATQVAAAKPQPRRPSYLAPVPELPPGSISAVGRLPAPAAQGPAPARNTLELTTLPAGEPPSAAPDAPSADVWTVTAQSLNVRRDAASTSPRLGALQYGERVTRLAQSGRWLLVESASGLQGWVFAKYLERDQVVATLD